MASYGLYKYTNNKEDSLVMSQSEAVENNRNSRTIDTRTIDKREQ